MLTFTFFYPAGEPHLDIFRTEADSFGNAGLTTFRSGMDVRYMEYWGEFWIALSIDPRHHAVREYKADVLLRDLCAVNRKPHRGVVISGDSRPDISNARDQEVLHFRTAGRPSLFERSIRTIQTSLEQRVAMGCRPLHVSGIVNHLHVCRLC